MIFKSSVPPVGELGSCRQGVVLSRVLVPHPRFVRGSTSTCWLWPNFLVQNACVHSTSRDCVYSIGSLNAVGDIVRKLWRMGSFSHWNTRGDVGWRCPSETELPVASAAGESGEFQRLSPTGLSFGFVARWVRARQVAVGCRRLVRAVIAKGEGMCFPFKFDPAILLPPLHLLINLIPATACQLKARGCWNLGLRAVCPTGRLEVGFGLLRFGLVR